ncbi:hypothetical protein [Actinophytocola sp.]|uniref:gp33 family protein n=1 Tax=Actinophytocola sp. TaxID=1872138 RepID=UPI002D7EDB48|nr:hypothetical protein [Actinophytocola sp.]HET9144124.1 hypothetical protein [Actinophytocola sp.]
MTTPDEAAAAPESTAPTTPQAEQPPTIDVAKIRELATVTDQLKAHEGAVADLKARKKQLSEEILEVFELHGLEDMRVDGRKAYIHRPTFPLYKEKPVEEGGGRYTAADAVEALRAIGRGAQVQPETVNYQTMGAILREYRDAEQPVPEALAKVVELGENAEIRVGAARK